MGTPDLWVVVGSACSGMILGVSTKAGWDQPAQVATVAELPVPTLAVIEQASRLTPAEITRLDAADRVGADARLVAWDLLRDALDGNPSRRDQRRVARNLAWEAVNESAVRAGLIALRTTAIGVSSLNQPRARPDWRDLRRVFL